MPGSGGKEPFLLSSLVMASVSYMLLPVGCRHKALLAKETCGISVDPCVAIHPVAESCLYPTSKVGYFSGCGLGPETVAKVIYKMELSGWWQWVVVGGQGMEGSEVRWERWLRHVFRLEELVFNSRDAVFLHSIIHFLLNFYLMTTLCWALCLGLGIQRDDLCTVHSGCVKILIIVHSIIQA